MTSARVAVVGIRGRMGQEILALAPELGIEVVAGVSHTAAGEMNGTKIVKSVADLSADQVDVVIDFSQPEATSDVLAWCAKNRRPLVSGVTGLTEVHKKSFADAGKVISVFWAPNMSLGVAVVARMLAQFKLLDGFEFQIEELHHKRKKDRPSGTALFLQEQLEKAVGKSPDPLAIRGGGIFGIHRIWAMGEEETITVEHTAMNRRVFARGALNAAKWILNKDPGLYRMDDLL